VQVQYMPSGQMARKLSMSPRSLGKITGNLYVSASGGGNEDRADVGLCVKHGAKGLCVPDYARPQPEERGWAYSEALLLVLEQYKVRQICVYLVTPLQLHSNLMQPEESG
jgi:5'-3' exoribonuclease 1